MLKKLQDINKKTKIKFFILLIFSVVTMIFILKNYTLILNKLDDAETIRQYVLSKGFLGFISFVFIQALHVLLVVIPGDIFNFTEGYVFGIPIGFSLSLLGIMAGTMSAFFISKILGAEFISKLVHHDKLKKISDLVNSTKGSFGILIICLLPFIPKDLLVYIAGLTPIKASRFFLIYGMSRIPGTLIWVSAGSQTQEKNLQGLVITFAIMACFIGIGVLLQKKYGKSILKS